jgi:DnaK suppressor protein
MLPEGREINYCRNEKMKQKDLEKFKNILVDKKQKILGNAVSTLSDDMTLDVADLPDEMDLASSEYLQSFQFRLRGRERTFLSKIDKAIAKIEEGEFGVCEECGESISPKRLEARPETTMCIKCKEEQEQEERQFGE